MSVLFIETIQHHSMDFTNIFTSFAEVLFYRYVTYNTETRVQLATIWCWDIRRKVLNIRYKIQHQTYTSGFPSSTTIFNHSFKPILILLHLFSWIFDTVKHFCKWFALLKEVTSKYDLGKWKCLCSRTFCKLHNLSLTVEKS